MSAGFHLFHSIPLLQGGEKGPSLASLSLGLAKRSLALVGLLAGNGNLLGWYGTIPRAVLDANLFLVGCEGLSWLLTHSSLMM